MPLLPRVLAPALVAALALACASGSPGAGASAPSPAAAATAQTTAGVVDFAGDWEFTAQMRDATVTGDWRLTRTDAGYTGVVASSLGRTSPIRSFSSRGRSFTLTFEVDGEPYTITGTAETPQTANGSLSFRGGMGRLQARRR
jgi:hypothetical protein